MGKILNLELCISLVWKMNIEIYIGSQYINKNSKISHCVMAGSMAAAEPTEQGAQGGLGGWQGAIFPTKF